MRDKIGTMREKRGTGRDNKGFKKLIVWQNAAEIRRLVYRITARLPVAELRRVSQMRDAARSFKQNIQEGYKKRSVKEYIKYLGNSQSSLAELEGDIDDCLEDGLITEQEFDRLKELCGKTDYLLNRQIQSLIKLDKEGRWRKYAVK